MSTGEAARHSDGAEARRTASGLQLTRPGEGDVDELHAIYSDPRVWTHLPAGRHVSEQQTRELVESWIESWAIHGLGQWVIRRSGSGALMGHGGCAVRHGCFWNLGYRLAPDAQGGGVATDVARTGVTAAREVAPELPIVAYLLEHNRASARVAEKSGLTLRHRGPDAGNPDADAVRLIFADRELSEDQLAATMR